MNTKLDRETLVWVAKQVTRNHQDAEDATAMALASCAKKGMSVEMVETSDLPYILTAVKNHAKNMNRSNSRLRTVAFDEELGALPDMAWENPDDETPEDPTSDGRTTQPDQVRSLLLKELWEAMVEGMSKLTDNHRSALEACLLEGKSSAQAAKESGVPEATIRTRLLHAKRAMQKHMGTYHQWL